MSQQNQWSLFGLDLSRAADHLRLGYTQLMFGEEAGLYPAMCPPVSLIDAEGRRRLATELGASTDAQSTFADDEPIALEVPDDLCLRRVMTLPASIEIDLPSAVALEARANSPFPLEDLRFGWTILERTASTIEIEIAMLSLASVSAWIRTHRPEYADGVPFELWVARSGCGHVVIEGFSEAARKEAYLRSVRSIAVRVAVLFILLVTLLTIPGFVVNWRAGQLEVALDNAQLEAGDATRIRGELVAKREISAALSDMERDRRDYIAWLDWLADVSPDSVYLQRLELEEGRAEIQGLADNAASYLTALAESGDLESVDAPSAFTRDRASGKERFVITMELP